MRLISGILLTSDLQAFCAYCDKRLLCPESITTQLCPSSSHLTNLDSIRIGDGDIFYCHYPAPRTYQACILKISTTATEAARP